jgi:hypothetical protein
MTLRSQLVGAGVEDEAGRRVCVVPMSPGCRPVGSLRATTHIRQATGQNLWTDGTAAEPGLIVVSASVKNEEQYEALAAGS